MSNHTNFPEIIYKLGGMHSFAAYWRYNPEFLRMTGSVCRGCGQKHFPRRDVCPECHSRNLQDAPLSQSGTIEAVGLQVHHYKTGYDDMVPQVHGIVRLDDGGPHVETEVVGLDQAWVQSFISHPREDYGFYDALIGKRVRMVIRRLRKQDNGLVSYGYKFQIVEPVPPRGV